MSQQDVTQGISACKRIVKEKQYTPFREHVKHSVIYSLLNM